MKEPYWKVYEAYFYAIDIKALECRFSFEDSTSLTIKYPLSYQNHVLHHLGLHVVITVNENNELARILTDDTYPMVRVLPEYSGGGV